MTRLTIVTGADAGFARCLYQFLRSAERTGAAREADWIAYDLGQRPEQAERLRQRFGWVEWRRFDASRWPAHVEVSRGNFAWKVAIIHDVIHERQSPVMWLDSATILHGRFDEVMDELARSGLYTLRGQTAVGLRTDPLTLQRLPAPLEWLDEPVRVAGAIAFDGSRPSMRALVDEWMSLALREDLIAPRQPKLRIHNDDQSLISLILAGRVRSGELALADGEIDISSSHPVRWMSSRNKTRADVPEWADPLARLYWFTWKTLDRWWLRLLAFDDRHVEGWLRGLRERFSVYVGRIGEPRGRRVPCAWSAYLADPFVVEHTSGTWLFAERFDHARDVGRIVAMRLGEDLSTSGAVELALPADHHSFPFVFAHEGQWFLLAETCARRCVDLYVFEEFPARPRLARRLLWDVDAVDSVLVRHAGRWWLVSSISQAGTGSRSLSIHFSDDLLRGAFTPHAVNGQGRDAGLAQGAGRAAGHWVAEDGRLYRPVQASRDYYGQRLAWREIIRLDVGVFEERESPGPASLNSVGTLPDSHHVSRSPHYWACDTRDRVGYGQGLRDLLGLRRPPAAVR